MPQYTVSQKRTSYQLITNTQPTAKPNVNAIWKYDAYMQRYMEILGTTVQ